MRILVLVPFPMDAAGIANREAQAGEADLSEAAQLSFRPVKVAPTFLDSYHDWVLSDVTILEAGMNAAQEGFDAVCIDTMSDGGVYALRSLLDIPVIGPGRASFLTALLLADSFSILTVWDAWLPAYKKVLRDCGLEDRCMSVRAISSEEPDLRNLLQGREEDIFPALEREALLCVEDGAEAICLGSTTMHQSHRYLASRLPVPVINPGPLTYKYAELLTGTALTQSRKTYPRPRQPKRDMIEAMVGGAA